MLVEQDPVSRSIVTDWLAQVLSEVDAPKEIAYGKVPRGEGVESGMEECRHHRRGRRRRLADEDALNQYFGHRKSRHGIQEKLPLPIGLFCTPTDHGPEERQRHQPENHLKGQGLATRHGLYPVFQEMEREAIIKERLDVNPHAKHSKKRKRSLSEDSYLEPAIMDETNVLEQRNNGVGHGTTPSTRYLRQGRAENSSDTTSSTSESSSQGIPSPEKPLKTYERRPRRRTKEDRYELKQEKARKTRVKRKITTKSKSKRKEKSGALNIQHFRAKNVASDRLTLRPAAKLGLFTRGRASAPVLRRGLPDLSFSEMTFLNGNKADQVNVPESKDKEKKRKKDKGVDADEEMSRFFNATKVPLSERNPNIPNPVQDLQPQDLWLRQLQSPRIKESYLVPIEQRTLEALDSGDRRYERRRLRREASNTPSLRPPSKPLSRSTTYFTWSQSPGVGRTLVRDGHRDTKLSEAPESQVGSQVKIPDVGDSVTRLHESINSSIKASPKARQKGPTGQETTGSQSRFSGKSINFKNRIECYLNELRSQNGCTTASHALCHPDTAENRHLSPDDPTSAVLDMLVDKFEDRFRQLAAVARHKPRPDTTDLEGQPESINDGYGQDQATRSALELQRMDLESPRKLTKHDVVSRHYLPGNPSELPTRGLKHSTITDTHLQDVLKSPWVAGSGWKGPGLIYGQQIQLHVPEEQARPTYGTKTLRDRQDMKGEMLFPSFTPQRAALRSSEVEMPQAVSYQKAVQDCTSNFARDNIDNDHSMEDLQPDDYTRSNHQYFSNHPTDHHRGSIYILDDFTFPSPNPTFNSRSRQRASELDRSTIDSRGRHRTATTASHVEASAEVNDQFGSTKDGHGGNDGGPKGFWKPNPLY